ncbi:MAG: hypothetical protein AMJ61_11190 [Desulfobacterales bacterium SG8_35_2]|jgi:hypothetical protein|nr:MAG: hypothetical protein AMJ61_11190 [Desulfobacterales bacterium SG8_35_2]
MSGINLDYYVIDAYLNLYVFLKLQCIQTTIEFMRCLIKKIRPLLALLLLLQATAVYALPADIHLNLCFGPDGHIKISTDFCAETLLIQESLPMSPDFSGDDHHGDCLDIILNCNTEEELFSPSEKTLLAKTEITVVSPPAVAEEGICFFPCQIVQSSILNTCLINRAPSSTHLGFISTTVLLI